MIFHEEEEDAIRQPLTGGNDDISGSNGGIKNAGQQQQQTQQQSQQQQQQHDKRVESVFIPAVSSTDDHKQTKIDRPVMLKPVPAGDVTESSAGSTPSDARSICDGSDPWLIPELQQSGAKDWNQCSNAEKAHRVALVLAKVFTLIGLLYFFICSLDLLSTAFRLLGSRAVGRFFQDNELLQNPVVGLMIGVLVTVLVQSSSTSTSIVVTMVASKIIEVRQAIPIVMGANIGTSVTNTIVSLMQSADRNEFRRAFAAATVHDMFNWLTVLVLLPLEATFRYLENLTTYIMKSEGNVQQDKTANREFLNAFTKPFTKMIIKIDKALLERIASGNDTDPNARILVNCCDERNVCKAGCRESFFGLLGLSDSTTGIILLILSVVVLCMCLIFLVKILNSMLTGHIAKLIKRTMNREYRFPYSLIADYSALVAGCILTILVQSSSIFTSALTPLAGIGVISIERIYPLTLGSNIGTTTTGILAALAADSSRIQDTLQLALCHLFFNLTGILLFYPIPCMRFPIPLAKRLGEITATYRWFSILYLLSMFFFLPLVVFTLSSLGRIAIIAVGGPSLVLFIFWLIISLLQRYHSNCLPAVLKNWHFLPLWMRSLKPLDRLLAKSSQRFGCVQCFSSDAYETKHHTHVITKDIDEDPEAKLKGPIITNQSQINILGSLHKSNSESQFESLIYSQGRLGMVFKFGHGAHGIHGFYHGPPRHKHRRAQRKAQKEGRIRRQSEQPSSAMNNNNVGEDGYGYYGRDADYATPPNSPDGPWAEYNSHTVHNCIGVHRDYPSSPFYSPARDASLHSKIAALAEKTMPTVEVFVEESQEEGESGSEKGRSPTPKPPKTPKKDDQV